MMAGIVFVLIIVVFYLLTVSSSAGHATVEDTRSTILSGCAGLGVVVVILIIVLFALVGGQL